MLPESRECVFNLPLIEMAHLADFFGKLAEIDVECAGRVFNHNDTFCNQMLLRMIIGVPEALIKATAFPRMGCRARIARDQTARGGAPP
jgi:hypothetical protein